MSLQSKYEDALRNQPSGRGTGTFHSNLMSVAALGIMLGLGDNQIEFDLSTHNGDKARVGEISETLRNAHRKVSVVDTDKPYTPPPKPLIPKVKIAQVKQTRTFNDMASEGSFTELIEASPVKMIDGPQYDAELMLECMYSPSDVLFIGDIYDTEVQTVAEWLTASDLRDKPFFIPNPMTGESVESGSGKQSFRCDATVKECKYTVIEFDERPIESQAKFWFGCINSGMPVQAVIHSGSKSLHGILKVDVAHDDWDSEIKEKLFANIFIPFGADRACSNKSRLSRLPSHHRQGKEQQRLLYLKEI